MQHRTVLRSWRSCKQYALSPGKGDAAPIQRDHSAPLVRITGFWPDWENDAERKSARAQRRKGAKMQKERLTFTDLPLAGPKTISCEFKYARRMFYCLRAMSVGRSNTSSSDVINWNTTNSENTIGNKITGSERRDASSPLTNQGCSEAKLPAPSSASATSVSAPIFTHHRDASQPPQSTNVPNPRAHPPPAPSQPGSPLASPSPPGPVPPPSPPLLHQ